MSNQEPCLPSGFRFHGLLAKPGETLFMRRKPDGEPEWLDVSFEDALKQPMDTLAHDPGEQEAIVETIQFHKARRERSAQP